MEYERILVPTDGSDGTVDVLAHALDLAGRHGAVVEALSVVDERALRDLPDERRAEARTTLERRAERAVAEVELHAEEVGVAATGTVSEGAPAPVILERAADPEVDVVVLGARGRSDYERHVRLGGVSERVVREADVPVVVVHVGE
ncbi:MAG: universal stress protein [Halorientalis sp.]